MRILRSTLAVLCLVALLPHAARAQAQKSEGVVALDPGSLTWQPMQGDPEVKVATLYGNPAESGHYIIRVKLPANHAGRPHTHGAAELLTVHSGACHLAHGEELTREAARKLSPGAFVAVPAGTKMRGFTGKEGCVVDVQGQGPYTTQYLDE